MELYLYIISAWIALSIISWVCLFEIDGFDNSKFHNIKVIFFLLSTLPVTITVTIFLLFLIIAERIEERRNLKRKIEISKYGVFKREVLIEKYCDHKWQDLNRPINFASRTKKFSCIKCKKKIDICWEEYRRMYDFGLIANDYTPASQRGSTYW